MLPPTMSTTPNSPIVWAKLRTTPVTTPAADKGKVTRKNVANRDIPSVHEASTSFGSTDPKADAKGWTANGRLQRTDAKRSPSKVKARDWPTSARYPWPRGHFGL